MPRVRPEKLRGFLLAVIGLEDSGPFRPWVVGKPVQRGGLAAGPLRAWVVWQAGPGGVGQALELGHAFAAVADGGSDAVGAGVAAPDHDDVLILRGDIIPVRKV